jgi:hypothetical protein
LWLDLQPRIVRRIPRFAVETSAVGLKRQLEECPKTELTGRFRGREKVPKTCNEEYDFQRVVVFRGVNVNLEVVEKPVPP